MGSIDNIPHDTKDVFAGSEEPESNSTAFGSAADCGRLLFFKNGSRFRHDFRLDFSFDATSSASGVAPVDSESSLAS